MAGQRVRPSQVRTLAMQASEAGQMWLATCLMIVAGAAEEGPEAIGSLASSSYTWAKQRVAVLQAKLAKIARDN